MAAVETLGSLKLLSDVIEQGVESKQIDRYQNAQK
jgi:hypothetical protein